MDGEKELKELFKYIEIDAQEFKACDMEKDVFSRIMRIGFAAMKYCFAKKGTGDVGMELTLENGTVLKKESTLRSRRYYSVFGKINVLRAYYHCEGMLGVAVMPVHICHSSGIASAVIIVINGRFDKRLCDGVQAAISMIGIFGFVLIAGLGPSTLFNCPLSK